MHSVHFCPGKDLDLVVEHEVPRGKVVQLGGSCVIGLSERIVEGL